MRASLTTSKLPAPLAPPPLVLCTPHAHTAALIVATCRVTDVASSHPYGSGSIAVYDLSQSQYTANYFPNPFVIEEES